MPLFARRSRRARLVKVGWVALGQLLSYVGTSGVERPHCHFVYWPLLQRSKKTWGPRLRLWLVSSARRQRIP